MNCNDYFISLISDSISFSDAQDFIKEIMNDFNFSDEKSIQYFESSSNELVIENDIKELLLNKIMSYMEYFEDFGECNNSIIVSGSLDYLSMALEMEALDLEMDKYLWGLLFNYLLDIKKIQDWCGGNPKVFEYMNLDSLEHKFNRIQEYISQDLSIFPKLDELIN